MADERKLMLEYASCRLCPRECGVDRNSGKKGFCNSDSPMKIAWAGLHKGEEPPLSDGEGSGTVFFTGCTMQCRFCQNGQLSCGGMGREVFPDELAGICLGLQSAGASNINFVTGTHFIPGIIETLRLCKKGGLRIPVVWNSSGFEQIEALKLLEPWIDLWLPDLKTLDPALSQDLFRSGDYPKAAVKAISWMATSSVKGIEWEQSGRRRNLRVILRHLALPGHMEDSREVLGWWSCNRVPGMVLSLMTQYIPTPLTEPSVPDRPLNRMEVEALAAMLEEFAIDDGFIQEPEASNYSFWLPDFAKPLPFPSQFARSFWFWKNDKL